jgi:hypothetical protein
LAGAGVGGFQKDNLRSSVDDAFSRARLVGQHATASWWDSSVRLAVCPAERQEAGALDFLPLTFIMEYRHVQLWRPNDIGTFY